MSLRLWSEIITQMNGYSAEYLDAPTDLSSVDMEF